MKKGDIVSYHTEKFIVIHPNPTMATVVNIVTGYKSSFPTHWLRVFSESR